MTGQTVILVGQSQRDFAKRLIDAAPDRAVVNVREGKRSLDQNAKMWAMLSDVSRAKCEGRSWPPEVWKAGFMSRLGYELEIYEGIDGARPFTVQRSSKLTVAEMNDLITSIYEYGDRHGVRWSDEVPA